MLAPLQALNSNIIFQHGSGSSDKEETFTQSKHTQSYACMH